MDQVITLDYGSGGRKTAELIDELIVPALENEALCRLDDGAVLLGEEKLVFSTDSFVVSPRFFPGGDIGKLAVCGTVNDVAMCGGGGRVCHRRCEYLSSHAPLLQEGVSDQGVCRPRSGCFLPLAMRLAGRPTERNAGGKRSPLPIH